ncbi:MAG: SOS response-associated peptidase [Candidatus Roseilinea sp.]|uniref:SOS response-associated peptidase n=1 Tax=Candidatus Roseilinea sp. TaxID=2838777 RepID=UPI00404A745D
MCGRYTLTVDEAVVLKRFDLQSSLAEHRPRFNIAPTQPVPVILNETPRQLSVARWGLIPGWAKDPSIGARLINARAETLPEKPAFRAAFARRRCLVIADGFYEWHKDGGAKTPMFIHLKSGEPFAFAGLWEIWQPPEGDPLRSCAIITTEPNELIATIHNRMPVILTREAERTWLDDNAEPAALMALLRPFEAQQMEAYTVSQRVNRPANDDAALIAPAIPMADA